MKPPSKIRIGAYEFRVVLDDIFDPASGELHSYGITKKAEELITLHKPQSPGNMRDTLLHELLHAACHASGAADDEGAIRALSGTVLQMLRSNPALVEFLLEP